MADTKLRGTPCRGDHAIIARLHAWLNICYRQHKSLLYSLLVVLFWTNEGKAESSLHFWANIDWLHIGVDGTIRSSDMEVYGTNIDIASDFDFDNINTFSGRCGLLFLNRHELLLDYREYHFSTTSSFSTVIRIGGIRLTPDVPNSVAMDVNITRLLYGIRLINRDTASLSLLGGMQYIRNELEIKADLFLFDYDVVRDSSESFTPFVLVTGEYNMTPQLAILGEVSAGTMGDSSEAFVQTMLRYAFQPQLSFEAGYIYHWNKYEAEKDLFETIFSGMLVGVRGNW